MATGRRRKAFRPGTIANQHSLALLYISFTIYFSFVDLPADERTLLCFAEFLLRSFVATKSVTNALSAVKRLHLDLGFSTVAFEAPALECWKKALLTLAVLRKLSLATYALPTHGSMFRAFFALLFYTMSRLSSLVPPTEASFDPTRHACRGDFAWRGTQWWFRVKWAKAHQRAEQGYWVPLLPRPGSRVCPVTALRALLLGGEAQGPEAPLFTVASGCPLAIPAARRWLRTLLTSIGEPPGAYTYHSFRRGACTAAFAQGAH